MNKKKLSHVNNKGDAHMVDVGDKADSSRRAIAMARILISGELYSLLNENKLAKGDAISVAKIAGIQAAKTTSDLIPLCHPIPITHVSLDVELIEKPPSVEIRAEVQTHYKTGVEMEALTAASVAALTIYDMGKSVDRGLIIESVKLLKKSGGRSGEWNRPESA
ncbi:MAG: cyclic pyranopterin monophosphate synthase MoaC [candidate division Zixibacteria bacterium]|nr:cyclic pyranopterin monophosphate synthase MoaC [candidate division Zixibacteria bacterium]